MTNDSFIYGCVRWRVGLLSLGFWATISILGLVLDGGTVFASCGHGPEITLATFWGCYVLLGFAFDFWGGYLLPKKHGRSSSTFTNWLSKWCRGSLLHAAYLWLASLALLRVAEHLGFWGSIAFVGVHMILLARFQFFFAKLLAPLRRVKSGRLPIEDGALSRLRIHTVESEDEAFTGGVAGPPGREGIIIPAHWQENLPTEVMSTLRARRLGTVISGSRSRGLFAAILWNLIWFSIAAWLSPQPLSSVAGLLHTIFWFSLFCTLGHTGLLALLSRRGSMEVDSWTHAKGACEFKLQQAISFTNKLQGEQPCKRNPLEAIFSAIPSVEKRLQHLFMKKHIRGAWNASYMMLFLSWAGLGLVSRAGPGNLGRPELWVFLPCD